MRRTEPVGSRAQRPARLWPLPLHSWKGANGDTCKNTFSLWLRRGKLQHSSSVGRTQPKKAACVRAERHRG